MAPALTPDDVIAKLRTHSGCWISDENAKRVLQPLVDAFNATHPHLHPMPDPDSPTGRDLLRYYDRPECDSGD
jgi:hypothetical protein